MKKEYIIKDLTSQEKCRLYKSEEAKYIDWHPFNLLSSPSNIVVVGTKEDVTKILIIIGRK